MFKNLLRNVGKRRRWVVAKGVNVEGNHFTRYSDDSFAYKNKRK